MKIHMNNILLLCVLVMLSFEVVGGAYCKGCHDVQSDNSCATKPYICKISRDKRRRCFIRRTQRNGMIMKVTRGCSSSCKTGSFYVKGTDVFTWCCSSDNCNSMNAWY